MASNRASPLPPRRMVAIKRVDGEPLTRSDIQFDVLSHIMNDRTSAFSDPYPTLGHASDKLCFRDLYIKSIINSPKATKALKDKMLESNVFAEDFAMVALLVNVGRINTTMSFFPEMKTAIRTYHPVPALQRTAGNLQDAPRIKHILKTSLLPAEAKQPPTTPQDVLKRARTPSTSIMNLLFVMSNHSGAIGQMHLPERLDFHDLFMRKDISSASRAKAFLWLCFKYLENPTQESNVLKSPPNPFVNPQIDQGGKVPVKFLSPAETALENVQPEHEVVLANKLVTQRNNILLSHTKDACKAHAASSNNLSGIGEDEDQIYSGDDVKFKGKRLTGRIEKAKRPLTQAEKEKNAFADKARREMMKGGELGQETPVYGIEIYGYDKDSNFANGLSHKEQDMSPSHAYSSHSSKAGQFWRHRSASPEPSSHPHSQRHCLSSPQKRNKYEKYMQVEEFCEFHQYEVRPEPVAPMTMLEHAWHVVNTSDPLMDSEGEQGDEQVRENYVQRLRIINQLRGKIPTTDPLLQHP